MGGAPTVVGGAPTVVGGAPTVVGASRLRVKMGNHPRSNIVKDERDYLFTDCQSILAR